MKRLIQYLCLFCAMGLLQPLMAQQPCTQVIGYSQVGYANTGWFHAGPNGVSNFESQVGDDRWQLLWNGGGGVDLWKDPNYVGWSNTIESPCTQNSTAPRRVLLSVSGPHGDDVSAWVTDIEATVATIRSKYPSVQKVILQAVVGGPNHQTCFNGTDSVRASWQHPYIDQAIAQVAAADANVLVGYSPEVLNCSHYVDSKGHFTLVGARIAGNRIGQYYAALAPSKREEVAPSQFVVYPNPGTGRFALQTEEIGDFQLKVYDRLGNLVFSGANSQEFDLSALADGVYAVRLVRDEKVETQKVVLQR